MREVECYTRIACQEARESDQQETLAASRRRKSPNFSRNRRVSLRSNSRGCSDGSFHLRPSRNLSQNRFEDQIALIAPVVAVRVLIQVSLQILLADGVINATDAALQKAPEALDGVRMNIAHNVDSGCVVNAPVLVAQRLAVCRFKLRDVVVGHMLIGVNGALWKDVSLCQFKQLMITFFSRSLCNDPAFALDNARDPGFVAHLWTSALPSHFAAEVGFVHLYRRLKLQVFGEQRTNLLEHAPCGFVGHRSFALDLFRRNPAASRTHQVHRVEPRPQTGGRFLQDRASERIDVPAARLAGVGCAPSDAVVLFVGLTRLAIRDAARKALFLDVLQAGIVVRELPQEVVEAIPQCWRDALLDRDVFSSGHDLLCRKRSLLSRDNCHSF